MPLSSHVSTASGQKMPVAEGTRLVVEFIEKFWCPTIASEDLQPRQASRL